MEEVKAVALVSGGIDSPVAVYLMQQLGVKHIILHFTNYKYTDLTSLEKTIKIAQLLGINYMYAIELSEILEKFVQEVDHSYYFVLLKRIQRKIAEVIAQREGCSLIVTGENLGQVSSQTLQNISVVEYGTTVPIIRPLFPLNKDEIVQLARKIGTFEISVGPEYCDVLGPSHPVTKADLKKVLQMEASLKENEFIKRIMTNLTRIEEGVFVLHAYQPDVEPVELSAVCRKRK